jgi:biotin synthase
MLHDITTRALAGGGCSVEEAMHLATETALPDLMAGANQIRKAFFDNRIHFCVIINARCGSCSQNCAFCSQSAHHATDVETYPLIGAEAIEQQADDLRSSGAGCCGIVTSGPTVTSEELDDICRAIEALRASGRKSACASLGQLDVSSLERLKAAGLTRYHHNLETSRAFYPTICTTQSWQARYDTVRAAQQAGLDVCCGGLFGLGESWADRVDLAVTLRELGVTHVPINFFNARPGTPLEHQPPLTADEALRIVAVYRYLLPAASLRVCGGRDKILADRQDEAFAAGANAMMTGNYLTTPGVDPASDRAMLDRLGLELTD